VEYFVIAMPRILILIVLGWILYVIIKRIFVKAKDANKNAQDAEKGEKKTDEKILQCTQCGCHVPESETKLVDEKIICNNPECNKIAHGD
jgi:formylmethanofuran dehydrogenase subunit E